MTAERHAPDGLLVQTGLTGALADIDDDPDAPDANWLTTGNNTNTVCRVSFPSPSANPTVGAGLQEFRIWVRRTGHTTNPTCEIQLWESGSLVASILAATTVSNTTGVILSGTWNASLLGTADGSAVECYIIGTRGGGSPAGRSSLEVGAVEWNAEVTSGPFASIVGDVPVSATPAALLDFSQHPSIVGDVPVSATPAALLDFSQHPSIVGDVPVSATPAALLDFSQHPSIVGDVPVSATPAALLDFTQHPSIVGDVPVSATPAALLDFTQHPSIVGDIPVSATPAAVMAFTSAGRGILGNITVTATPAALLDFSQHPSIVGNVPVSASPAALLDFAQHPAIIGDVPVGATPVALLDFSQHPSIVGNVPVSATPAALLDFTAQAAIMGDIQAGATPSALLEFHLAPLAAGFVLGEVSAFPAVIIDGISIWPTALKTRIGGGPAVLGESRSVPALGGTIKLGGDA